MKAKEKETKQQKRKKITIKQDNKIGKEIIKIDDSLKKEDNETQKNNFNTLEVIVIMIITALFGIFIGSAVTYFKDKGGFSRYSKEIKELILTYEDVVENYYGEIDNDELLESGIKGMIGYLGDPYSTYMDSDAAEEFNEKLEGEYIGLGAEISFNLKDKILTVTKVLEDSPAEKSKLKENDIIYKVDNIDVKELELEEITAIIKEGKIGTKVRLDVKREEENIVIEFERGTVQLTSVTGEIIEAKDKKVGLITIEIFAKNTYKQFERVIEYLKEQGAKYLIIDVRGNTGGYLSTVKSIADMFLDKKDVIYILEDKNGSEKEVAVKKKSIELPTVMLINGGSASASEVLAAALNENLSIDLIGLNTYGKGSVQHTKTLSSGATIKYTIQKWFTPSGKSIEGDGIAPTIEIEQSKEYYDNPTKENDKQLQKAIEVVVNK